MADENTAVTPPVTEGTPPADTNQITPPADQAAAAAAAEATVETTSELVTPPATEVDAVAHEVGDDGAISYEATGDAALDVALTFIGSLGFAGDNPAVIAAANGDFSLLEAQLAVLGDKAAGWQQMVALAKDAYSRSEANIKDQVAKSDAAILAVVQTPENWAAIKTWAAANADPAEKTAINQMIDAGPVQARAAALLLLTGYQKATGTIVNPAQAVNGNASGAAAAATNTRLSAREYSEKVADLHRKLGSRMEGSQEYADLRRRLAR